MKNLFNSSNSSNSSNSDNSPASAVSRGEVSLKVVADYGRQLREILDSAPVQGALDLGTSVLDHFVFAREAPAFFGNLVSSFLAYESNSFALRDVKVVSITGGGPRLPFFRVCDGNTVNYSVTDLLKLNADDQINSVKCQYKGLIYAYAWTQGLFGDVSSAASVPKVAAGIPFKGVASGFMTPAFFYKGEDGDRPGYIGLTGIRYFLLTMAGVAGIVDAAIGDEFSKEVSAYLSGAASRLRGHQSNGKAIIKRKKNQ